MNSWQSHEGPIKCRSRPDAHAQLYGFKPLKIQGPLQKKLLPRKYSAYSPKLYKLLEKCFQNERHEGRRLIAKRKRKEDGETLGDEKEEREIWPRYKRPRSVKLQKRLWFNQNDSRSTEGTMTRAQLCKLMCFPLAQARRKILAKLLDGGTSFRVGK